MYVKLLFSPICFSSCVTFTTFAPSNDISVIAVGTQATLSFHRGEALYTNEQWDELKAKVVPRRDEGVTVGGTKTRFLIELGIAIYRCYTYREPGRKNAPYVLQNFTLENDGAGLGKWQNP